MKYEEFIVAVQKRALFETKIEAEHATRAALETLAECLAKKERSDAASQLPLGLALYLKQPFLGDSKQPAPSHPPPLSLDEFLQRMSIREDIPPLVALEHARVVMGVLADALSRGELKEVCDQLPIEFYYEFFEGRVKP